MRKSAYINIVNGGTDNHYIMSDMLKDEIYSIAEDTEFQYDYKLKTDKEAIAFIFNSTKIMKMILGQLRTNIQDDIILIDNDVESKSLHNMSDEINRLLNQLKRTKK